MNLLDLVVKITCDDQASGEVSGIGSKITGALGTAAKVGGAAVAALGAATIAVGKTALDAYANYEQLVGGIDTLFKGSSAKMQQYAADAYKTAGVSANRYMEISTSFAAALINSLGGDTAAAADMANMAIMDMSDNANKMGTSLEVVQEAYQSLARGNYEMLDSLKLGYGGTKTELERLLSDAEQIAAAQGTVRDFSVDSYSDIVEAIHLVQDEMGVTGTTAEEAATTISGSINMAKAAWENWLTGLGNENADMQGLTDQLVDAVVTAGENIIPRVGQIMTTLGQTVADYAPGVALYLRNALIGLLPEAVQGPMRDAFSGIDGIIAEFGAKFGALLGPAMEAGSAVLSALGDGMTVFGSAVMSLVLPAIQQLAPIFEQLFNAISAAQPVLSLIAQVIGVVLASALSVAVQVFGLLVQGVTGALQILQGLYDFIVGFVAGVVRFFTADLPAGFNAFIAAVSAIPGKVMAFLSSLLASVDGWVGSMVSNAARAGSQFVSNVVSFISGLPGRIAGFLSSVISRVSSWVSNMASKASSAASRFASNLINGLQSIPGKVVSIGSDIIRGMVDGVVNAAGMLIDAVGGAVNDAIGWAKSLLGIASPSKVFREIGQFTMQGAALGVEDDAAALSHSTGDAMRGMIGAARSAAGAPAHLLPQTAGDTVYNVYIDGSVLHADSVVERYLEDFVREVASYVTRSSYRPALA